LAAGFTLIEVELAPDMLEELAGSSKGRDSVRGFDPIENRRAESAATVCGAA
jgi:hypothetical protein